jgi:hypothetical protein
MTFKIVAAPLAFSVLALLLVYTQPDISCVVRFLAKVATNISL